MGGEGGRGPRRVGVETNARNDLRVSWYDCTVSLSRLEFPSTLFAFRWLDDRFSFRCHCPVAKGRVMTRLARRWSLVFSVRLLCRCIKKVLDSQATSTLVAEPVLHGARVRNRRFSSDTK